MLGKGSTNNTSTPAPFSQRPALDIGDRVNHERLHVPALDAGERVNEQRLKLPALETWDLGWSGRVQRSTRMFRRRKDETLGAVDRKKSGPSNGSLLRQNRPRATI